MAPKGGQIWLPDLASDWPQTLASDLVSGPASALGLVLLVSLDMLNCRMGVQAERLDSCKGLRLVLRMYRTRNGH